MGEWEVVVVVGGGKWGGTRQSQPCQLASVDTPDTCAGDHSCHTHITANHTAVVYYGVSRKTRSISCVVYFVVCGRGGGVRRGGEERGGAVINHGQRQLHCGRCNCIAQALPATWLEGTSTHRNKQTVEL